MPVFFWGDPDGTKYRSAYFEAFDGEEVWAHGDFVKVTFRTRRLGSYRFEVLWKCSMRGV